MLGLLDAFSNHFQRETARHGDDGLDQGAIAGILIDIARTCFRHSSLKTAYTVMKTWLFWVRPVRVGDFAQAALDLSDL